LVCCPVSVCTVFLFGNAGTKEVGDAVVKELKKMLKT
jgi:hypothetical protein